MECDDESSFPFALSSSLAVLLLDWA